ncbi:DUF6284 family protein [Streptomyces olivochromogenes]|uniref:Uncharacterized protein n=1 Tax=Streptomyces olivochromogenes TaxID=1963 RepID=A0A250VGC0_STROL|nr:DUF6284 family protein [Streptomyces olivochromogenes]KUN44365.1 hypothetical protein AQJ27_26585 [Streptomyces olivochromogenes]GAX53116.1 hypothetical protein SO3561_04641 [Streptomyces olivochromogenes]
MDHIVTVQEAVTAFADWNDPTDAELAAIESEMPLILADVDLIDAQIIAMDHTPNEVDTRRVRRALARVLTEYRILANRTTDETLGGAA